MYAALLCAAVTENGHIIYLFMGSVGGGNAAAIAYTLMETCKLNNVDLQAWLAWVLQRLLITRSIASTNSCHGIGRLKSPETAPQPDGYNLCGISGIQSIRKADSNRSDRVRATTPLWSTFTLPLTTARSAALGGLGTDLRKARGDLYRRDSPAGRSDPPRAGPGYRRYPRPKRLP